MWTVFTLKQFYSLRKLKRDTDTCCSVCLRKINMPPLLVVWDLRKRFKAQVDNHTTLMIYLKLFLWYGYYYQYKLLWCSVLSSSANCEISNNYKTLYIHTYIIYVMIGCDCANALTGNLSCFDRTQCKSPSSKQS